MRLGHPARVLPELRARALDILAEKHPDARQARKIARDAFALFRQADRWTRARPQPGEKAALRREAKEMLGRSPSSSKRGRSSGCWTRRASLRHAYRAGQPTARPAPLRCRGDRRGLPGHGARGAGSRCFARISWSSRAITSSFRPRSFPTKRRMRGLAVSLMERLVGLFGPDVARLLTVQHRMNTAIMGFSNEEFYGGQLMAAESVAGHRLCDLPGVRAEPLTESPVQFIDTAGASYDEELEEDTGSRRNLQEADLAGAARAAVAGGGSISGATWRHHSIPGAGPRAARTPGRCSEY